MHLLYPIHFLKNRFSCQSVKCQNVKRYGEGGFHMLDMSVRLLSDSARAKPNYVTSVGSKIQTVRKQVRASLPLRCTRVNKTQKYISFRSRKQQKFG